MAIIERTLTNVKRLYTRKRQSEACSRSCGESRIVNYSPIFYFLFFIFYFFWLFANSKWPCPCVNVPVCDCHMQCFSNPTFKPDFKTSIKHSMPIYSNIWYHQIISYKQRVSYILLQFKYLSLSTLLWTTRAKCNNCCYLILLYYINLLIKMIYTCLIYIPIFVHIYCHVMSKLHVNVKH